MSIKRPWAFWRRLQYGAGFVTLLSLFIVGSYLTFYEETYDCFDGLQNGNESGMDCGGDCVRICAAEVIPPRVEWVKSFEIMPGQYNTVAYVENINDLAGVEALPYTLTLYVDDDVVATRSGVTVLPPDSIYPIFEGRIQTDGRKVTKTTLTLGTDVIWQPANLGREQFRTSGIKLSSADVRPRLEATIENVELTKADEIEIVATLFSDTGIPLTASQTYIEELGARSFKDIVFTWPNSIAKTVRSCSIPSDVVLAIDLSGSMNNDAVDPPQPVTSALQAAANFVTRLGESDQVGVVTFASEAMTNAELSSSHASVAASIKALSIDPVEETGYTNTIAALEAVREELASPRHSEDARRAVVFLTDGLPTGQTDTETLIAGATSTAAALAESGVAVYSIGLGQNVNESFISELASASDNAYLAPSGDDLDQIYTQITSALCESGTNKIDIIAKTKTNFQPLR